MLFEPLNSSHLDQSDNLSRLPDVAEVLEGDEGEGDVEGEEGEEVDQVHRLDEEPRLDRTAQQPERGSFLIFVHFFTRTHFEA